MICGPESCARRTTLAKRDAQLDFLTGQGSTDPTAGAGPYGPTSNDAFGSNGVQLRRRRRHPEVFGNAATAQSFGFFQAPDHSWHVRPDCHR